MIMGVEPARVGNFLLTSMLPHIEPDRHLGASQRIEFELEKTLEDKSTQHMIMNSIRRHVEQRCSICSQIRAQNVVRVDHDHYGDLHALMKGKKMDLVYVRPRTAGIIAHTFYDHKITLELPLALSEQQHTKITIGRRSLTLGHAAYIEHDMIRYENKSNFHIIVLRTYL